MLQPTSKNNQLGLSGQSLFGYGQAKKARQLSGAATIQPIQNSGLPGTSDFQKPKGPSRPLVGMQSQPKAGVPRTAQYYETQATPLSQKPKPIDQGIYGPIGSNNRTAADEAYHSFKGPVIGKGPLVPNTSGNPSDYLQRLYSGNAMQGGMQRVEDNASKQDPQEPKLVQTQYDWEYNDAARKILNGAQQAIRRAYESMPTIPAYDDVVRPNQASPQQSTPTQAAPSQPIARQQSAQNPYGNAPTSRANPTADQWAAMGVDPSDFYNVQAGNVGQAEWEAIKQQAIQAQREKFNTISPERQSQLDADIARDRDLAANAAADAQRNLGFTGASIGNQTDYLNKQADIYGSRADSADAANRRLEAGGGLQYRQGSTGFGTTEQGAQAAADFRAMGAADKAKQDAYNAQQDAQFDDWRAKQAEIYGQQQSELGVRDPQQASTDIKSLTGQFASITRSGQAKGLKFLDFIQNKIDRGELGIGDDSVKIISKNYNHEFSDQDKDRAGMYQQQWGNPLNAARDAYGQRQAAQDEVRAAGMAQRQQIAAQQGADRAREAKLIAQGLTPAAARAAVAQQNATADYYNQQRLNNQDRLTADILTRQAELAQKDQEDARRYLDRESQRAYDALNPKATGSGKARQPNAADGSAGSKGTGSKSKSLENPRVSSAVDSLTQDKTFKKSDPGALLSASKHFETKGLSLEEQSQGLGQLFDADFSDRDVATGTVRNLATYARDLAKKQGSFWDQHGLVQRRVDANILDHATALRAIGYASGMTPQEIAEQVYPEGWRMGTFDPGLADKRQRLIEALGASGQSSAQE